MAISRMHRSIRLPFPDVAILALLALVAPGCNNSPTPGGGHDASLELSDGTAGGTGGGVGGSDQGGQTGSGGTGATGGAVGTGGSNNGGATGTGGATGAGGATISTGTGGTYGAGGVGAGGAGGTTGIGGALGRGGVTGSGGRSEIGGATGTGGTGIVASGGATRTGGTTGAGGSTGTGGTTPSGRIHYVSPTGKSTNDGTSFTSALDLTTALARLAAGETILMQGGTYTIPFQAGQSNTITLSKAGTTDKPLNLFAEPGKIATVDFQCPANTYVDQSVGFMVSGSYWYWRGIAVTRSPYQGVYVTGSHNTFENCAFYDNRNTGLEINKGGSYTTVINCDAYQNYDPKKQGSMADGFGPKQTQGPGNKLIGCRAWENSDDGFDAYDSPEVVTFDGCWAFRNGIDVWSYGDFAGNGNGFKAGGNGARANHVLRQCVAFENRVKGFDQNNNSGGITVTNCLSANNGTNYGLTGNLASGEKHVLKNNVALGATGGIANATEANNAWTLGLTVTAADFLSVDTAALGKTARAPDGTLPATDLFRLKAGSKLIDAGTDVGLPFQGSAPDLGPFESNP
jgi:hypothetical protein